MPRVLEIAIQTALAKRGVAVVVLPGRFSSGYRAMMECDTLLMLGTDFPYQQFYPDKATIIQVDIRGEQRRVRDHAGTAALDSLGGNSALAEALVTFRLLHQQLGSRVVKAARPQR